MACDDASVYPPRAEAASLYLDLSRFFENWEERDCAKVYRERPGDSAQSVMHRLLNCIKSDDACAIVSETRQRRIKELIEKGFGDLVKDDWL
jgi:hypothetical protein